MFSGGDSSDGINNINQLGAYGFVNQAAVSNAIAGGQDIDWAQLAQQWIQMRDNSELETKIESNASANRNGGDIISNIKFEEKGEADMDMDDEEQSDEKSIQRINSEVTPSSVVHNNFNQSWFFGEENSHIAGNNLWNPWPNRENLTNNRSTNPTSHIPSLLKISVPHPNEIRVMPDISNQSNNTNMMDAAKRKGLPAWIREGLEKMEREKHKQLEKQHQNKDMNLSDEDNSFNKNIDKPTNSLSGVPPTVFDEESTDNEDVSIKTYSQKDVVNLKDVNEEDDRCSSSEDKTYEQKLSELMIVVRRTLTELLLEATNEEMSKVAEETIKTLKSKASSAQVIRKSALSTLTNKLGLAVYGDSSSENDSDNDGSSSPKKTSGHSESDNDSEEELRNVIRLKRRAFIKTSEEIEERVSAAAAREEEKLKYFLRKEEEEKDHNRGKHERSLLVRDPSSSGHSRYNNFKGYEKDFGEITETKIQHLNGKRQKERSSRRERITRFSDNKDKYVALPNAATFLANLSSATNFASGNTNITPATNSQRQNIPDVNGLLPNYTTTGMTNALNAADAALEKALKAKSLANNEKQSRRREEDHNYIQSKKRRLSESKYSRSRSNTSSSSTSSSSTSTSSDSDSSSTSRSSHQSKCKHQSLKKHKSRTSVERQYEKSRKDNRTDRKYQSSSYKRRDRESKSSRTHRSESTDSEDEYRRRYRNESNYSRHSSKTRSYSSSRRTRDREHSRSKSRSYTSNNRRQ